MTATASYDRDTSFQRQQTKSNEQGENKQTRTTMKMHTRTSKTNTWTNIEEKTNSDGLPKWGRKERKTTKNKHKFESKDNEKVRGQRRSHRATTKSKDNDTVSKV